MMLKIIHMDRLYLKNDGSKRDIIIDDIKAEFFLMLNHFNPPPTNHTRL